MSISLEQRVRDCAEDLERLGVCALGGLFDLSSRRLVRYAITITGHQDDAEDAVQTALIRVANRPSGLAAAERPWSYLLTVVRNEALNIGRRQRRLTFLSDLRDLITRPHRSDELEARERRDSVWTALRQLPAKQAEVVVLKVWEEMTFAQIAEVLNTSPNTVASRYQYAIQKLNARLRKYATEPADAS